MYKIEKMLSDTSTKVLLVEKSPYIKIPKIKKEKIENENL